MASVTTSTMALVRGSGSYKSTIWTHDYIPSLTITYRMASVMTSVIAPVRRSGNYKSTIWTHDHIQSITTTYQGDKSHDREQKLKEEIRVSLKATTNTLNQLELVDTLKRLGISYHFLPEIEELLKNIYSTNLNSVDNWKKDLHATALEFRLLREHGFLATSEIFRAFMDKKGEFELSLGDDIKGMLSLYEASFLSVEDEKILDMATEFTTKSLKESLDKNKCDGDLEKLVRHALQLPLYWRMLRLEARWFITSYEKMEGSKNNILLELAKLDFNKVQAKYQGEIKQTSKWYRAVGVAEKLEFGRDRLFENFLFACGFCFEPQFEYCRILTTKIFGLITFIDDIYDVYGTLDELELFTDVIQRWDINAMEQLPDYMKICFLALFNVVNEMAYDILKEQDVNIISYLKKTWSDHCNSYLVEAKWYASGYTPSLDEYLETGLVSIGGPAVIIHEYFCINKHLTKQEDMETYSDLIRSTSMIARLVDDLGTAPDEKKKGDNPKAIECYMHETGVSEEDARKHIMHLVRELWKKVNQASFSDSQFSKRYIELLKNYSRTFHCFYQDGDVYEDGYGCPDKETKRIVVSLVVDPIPFK